MIRTLFKRDLDSGGGLQTSGGLRLADGGSAKPLGDLTHPANSGFYNAPYCKAVAIKNNGSGYPLPFSIYKNRKSIDN